MDRFHDSKATPTKEPEKNNSDSVHTGKNIDNDTSKIIAPRMVPTTRLQQPLLYLMKCLQERLNK